jgi:hypothetical protein
MRSRVNQKLYFARLLLEQAEQADAAPACQALVQGALFHMVTAYRCYLREIAASQRQTIEALDARAAVRQLAGRAGPEFTELAALEQAGQWPAHLLRAFTEAAALTAAPASASAADIPLAGIPVAQVSETAPADCRRWLEAFQAVLEQQREQLQEW